MFMEKKSIVISIVSEALRAIAKGFPQYLEIFNLLYLNFLILQKKTHPT